MEPNFTKYQGKISVVHDSLEEPNDDELVDVAVGLFDAAKIRLHSGYAGLLVLTDGGDEVLGAVATSPDESQDGERLMVEFSVVSAPAYRRQGVVAYGIQQLLKESRELAREYDMAELLVYCYVANPYMTGLLTDLGFAPLDYEVFQSNGYWGVFLDPWGMEKNGTSWEKEDGLSVLHLPEGDVYTNTVYKGSRREGGKKKLWMLVAISHEGRRGRQERIEYPETYESEAEAMQDKEALDFLRQELQSHLAEGSFQTEVPSSRWAAYLKRNPGASDPGFKAYIAGLRKRNEAYHALVAQTFDKEDIYVTETNRGTTATLTKSTRPGVRYQVTFWTDGEPTGHIDAMDMEEAVKTLRSFDMKTLKQIEETGTAEVGGRFTRNPFVSEAQRRACWAKKDPRWDCRKWQRET